MDKKYQIFVSSTYEDLKEERDQAINDFRQYSSSDTLINLKVLKHIAICHYRLGNKEELDKIINHLSEVNPTESKKILEKIKEIEG